MMQLNLPILFCRKVHRYFSKSCISRWNHSYENCIDISPEVSIALKNHKPVVALESTIISHGMPYPKNVQTSLQVEEIIRNQGAVPATIAIIKGRIKVGLDQDELTEFASLKTPVVKTSRRDFPYVLSKDLNGGTTVAGTVVVASAVGIKVFVTGGLGGVHRGGETTMDVSADLTELGRNSIAVVSSGVKSILDIEKTLEYLETQGVCVITYGKTKEFPSFYTTQSGLESPYNVETPADAASLINKLFQLRLNSGLLLAVPIPEEYAMEGDQIGNAIVAAVREAETQGIKGKEVTPFILNSVMDLTGGKSLESNIALIKNNAKIGAQVACELEKIKINATKQSSCYTELYHSLQTTSAEKGTIKPPSIAVIGGSVLDCVISVNENSILANGSTHRGEIKQSGGGVGRNLADALGKLGTRPFLISAIGNDQTGDFLLQSTMKHIDTRGVVFLNSHRTACYSAVVDRNGECYFGVGDMDINDTITPNLVEKFLEKIQQSSLVVMDGNIPIETMDYVLNVCRTSMIPVWFEPTDMRKAGKVFQCRHWTSLGYVSPNLNELQVMAQASGLFYSLSQFDTTNYGDESIINDASFLARSLVEHIGTAVVTMGKLGILVVREGEADEPLLQPCHSIPHTKSKISVRYYPVPFSIAEQKIVNVSGAGDCLAAGILESMLRGHTERDCVAAGFVAASWSLQSSSAVPDDVLPSDILENLEFTLIHS